MQAHLEGGRTRLFTRRGHDWTPRFAALAGALTDLPANSLILDGEVIVQGETSVADFDAQTAAKKKDASYTDFLEEVLRAEREARRMRAREMLTRTAGFPAMKSLEAYGGGDKFISLVVVMAAAAILVPSSPSVTDRTCRDSPVATLLANDLVVAAEPVPNSGLGQDVAGALGIFLYLLPQLAYVDAQVLHVALWAPNLFHDHAVSEDLASVDDQHAQDAPLLVRQLHVLPTYADEPSGEVDREIAAREEGFNALALHCMAQRGPNAGRQSAIPNGFVT